MSDELAVKAIKIKYAKRTPAEVLDLPMNKRRNDAKASTVRGYLVTLLATLWDKKDSFSGKHPFGNSGWEHAIYDTLVEHGAVRGSASEYNDGKGIVREYQCDDTAKADKLIAKAIQAL